MSSQVNQPGGKGVEREMRSKEVEVELGGKVEDDECQQDGTMSSISPKRPSCHTNPPHHHGRLKTRPTNISQPKHMEPIGCNGNGTGLLGECPRATTTKDEGHRGPYVDTDTIDTIIHLHIQLTILGNHASVALRLRTLHITATFGHTYLLFNRAINKLMRDSKRKKCNLSQEQVFSKLHYETDVKEKFEAKCDKLDLPSDAKAEQTAVQTKLTKESWAECLRNKTQKQQVLDEKARLNAVNTSLRRGVEVNDNLQAGHSWELKQRAINDLPAMLNKLLEGLENETDWSFTILAGGPDLSNSGKIKTFSLHIGETTLGMNFMQSHANFGDHVMKPFDTFIRYMHYGSEPVSKELQGEATQTPPPSNSTNHDTSVSSDDGVSINPHSSSVMSEQYPLSNTYTHTQSSPPLGVYLPPAPGSSSQSHSSDSFYRSNMPPLSQDHSFLDSMYDNNHYDDMTEDDMGIFGHSSEPTSPYAQSSSSHVVSQPPSAASSRSFQSSMVSSHHSSPFNPPSNSGILQPQPVLLPGVPAQDAGPSHLTGLQNPPEIAPYIHSCTPAMGGAGVTNASVHPGVFDPSFNFPHPYLCSQPRSVTTLPVQWQIPKKITIFHLDGVCVGSLPILNALPSTSHVESGRLSPVANASLMPPPSILAPVQELKLSTFEPPMSNVHTHQVSPPPKTVPQVLPPLGTVAEIMMVSSGSKEALQPITPAQAKIPPPIPSPVVPEEQPGLSMSMPCQSGHLLVPLTRNAAANEIGAVKSARGRKK
ncbi:hypothetical protein BDN67DRAFT_1014522 [Paxillus ammoniavirescens]|nr:hypothetical protein BDN67DRAFT_1014522 [Paxillus ammoniavirescens]